MLGVCIPPALIGLILDAGPVDLHQRHARLDQTPREQDALGKSAAAVTIANAVWFLPDIERVAGRGSGQQVERLFRVNAVSGDLGIVGQ